MAEGEQAQWWPESALSADTVRSLAQPTVDRLCFALQQERMPPALLLVGPSGFGRELCAVEAAAMLTCPAGESGGEPYCTCGSCSRVRRGLHPDVKAVLPEGVARRIPIDRVRSIVSDAQGRPFEARCRVWILDGVEATRFGAEAANAFLKTLEEPPGHVRFILLASNPEAVLPTIRSRCQSLALPGERAVALHERTASNVPELLSADASAVWMDVRFEAAKLALQSSLDCGDPLPLLRLAYGLTRECSEQTEDVTLALSLCSAAALHGACEADDGGEELAVLASELLAVERRTLALNLAPERQLASVLLSWWNGTAAAQR